LLVCPDGFYADTMITKCVKCPDTCATCLSATKCLTCKDGYIVSNGLCVVCEEKKGYYTKGKVCDEICGDGLNLGMHECDDGNTIDGDGCSSRCTIEDGFKCYKGTSGADRCVVLTTAYVTIEGNKPGTLPLIRLVFDKDVEIKGDWTQVLQIARTSNNQIIKDFKVTAISKSVFEISLENYQYDTSRIKFTIAIVKPSLLRDNENLPVFFYARTVEVDFSAMSTQNMGFGSAANTFTAAAASSTAVTLAVSGSANLMWKLLDAFQAVSFFALVSVTYSPFLVKVFDLMDFANLSWLPNPLEYFENLVGAGSGEEGKKSPPKFEERGFEASFLLNSGQILGLMVVLWAMIYIMRYAKKRSNHKIVQAGVKYCTKNNLIKIALNVYLLLVIGCMLQNIRLDWSSVFSILSCMLSFLVTAVLVTAPAMIFNFLAKNEKRLTTPEFEKEYGSLFEDYKLDTYYSRNYVVLNLFSKMTFGMSLVLFYKVPTLQVLGIFLSKCFKFVTLLKIKPYKDRSNQNLELVNEGLSALTSIPIFFLALNEENTNKKALSWTVEGLIMLILGINMALAFYEQFLFYIKTFQSCRKRKKKQNIVIKMGHNGNGKGKGSESKYRTNSSKSKVDLQKPTKPMPIKGRRLKPLNASQIVTNNP